MKILDDINVLFLKNRELIFFILETIKKCIPENRWDAFYNQINCINKVQWVLDKEVDLFYHRDCDLPPILNQKEEKIATVIIEDNKNKQYKIDIYVVEGKVFSLESNLPFRKLLVSDIKTIRVQCHTTLK
jgi:hypothetical protein